MTANGSSVVDYVIMSFSLMPYIARFLIEPYDPCMSDVHKPLCSRIMDATYVFLCNY